MHSIYTGESSLDDRSAQVFPYNIFTYCSIYKVDCKFVRNKIKPEYNHIILQVNLQVYRPAIDALDRLAL
jgi:hypothetical protein